MKQKPTRDVEVGDRITRTRRGEAESIFTVAEVLSRRGKVRRVRAEDGREVLLRIRDDGGVCDGRDGGVWSSMSYRRAEPGDDVAICERKDRDALLAALDAARVLTWPIEDVRRVLAAWPEEKK